MRVQTLNLLKRSIFYSLCVLPLSGIAAPQETFLPPQRIPVDANVLKMVVSDVNGDGFDDVVTLTSDGIVIYLNEGKVRATSEDVTFIKQDPIPLLTHPNTEAAEDNIRFSGGADLQVIDLDGDGAPDLLISNASTGEIFVLWNQGEEAKKSFVFVPDTDLPTDPSMTILSPLAERTFGGSGGVLGTPIYVAAANLGDGSGRKSIIAYHGSLQPDPTSADDPPFNQRNYESIGIIYPAKGTKRGFDVAAQRLAWPNCDLAFGGASPGCVGWNDGMPANAPLYNFRAADGARLNFDDAASDILTMDGWNPPTAFGPKSYMPAVLRPNASPGFQILAGAGANGSDSIWLDAAQQMNEFVHDNALKLMRRRNAMPTIEGNERSSGSTFATLSTGQIALITAGGMDVYYEPSNAGSVVKQAVPDYLNRSGQVGGWLSWTKLNSGSALMSMSDYCRAPDPCVRTNSWYHLPLDGTAAPVAQWGGSYGLVMIDYADEVTAPGGTKFAPFFDDLDDGRFQAFSVTDGGVTHKPFIASGNFASLTERALVVLDHQDGAIDDPNFTHLKLFRPDVAKTYTSPVPHLDGLTVGRFIADGLTDIGNTLPKGETSGVLVGSQLGVGINDAIRYVVVRDKATHSAVGVFPANPAENVKDISKDGIVVPGLSTLDIGQYTLTAYNANASASMDLKIVNPFGITTTDYDWSAGGECGLLPNTKDGSLWPTHIAVAVSDFPGADQLQAVRWIKSDGTVVDLPASGYATYDAASASVVLTIPQDGKLSDGRWKPFIKAAGIWQEVPRSWNIAHDSATVELCAKKVNFVNEEAYSQVSNKDYYLDAAQYQGWPYLANGSFRFFGTGFVESRIRSAALKQGNKYFFSSSLNVDSDNQIDVNFGDLGDSLTADADVDLFFYSETSDVVLANGVSASGGRVAWRTVRKGTGIPKLPQITDILNSGTGPDGTFLSGDTIKVSGKNLLYPVPTAIKLALKDADGSIYVLENPRLPDDWYSTHYDNDNLVLYFDVPDDLTTAKISDGSSSGATELGAGLVVAGSGALATTAVSEGALSALLSNPVSAIATIGATATGLSIYAGVENSIWLYKKVTMALSKPDTGPTDITKPGQSADDQTHDPKRLILFSYELGKPNDSRNRFIYASTLELPYSDVIFIEEQARFRVASLEGLSTLQVSLLGEDYWPYSNAIITDVVDVGSVDQHPSSINFRYFICQSNGWNMAPLANVHTERLSSGLLSWKVNAYFGWSPPWDLTPDNFHCDQESQDIKLDQFLTAF